MTSNDQCDTRPYDLLFISGSAIDENEVRKILSESGSIYRPKRIQSGSLVEQGVTMGSFGFDPNEYCSRVIEANRISVDETGGGLVIVTCQPIKSRFLLTRLGNQNIVIISAATLVGEKISSREIATLIVAAVARLLFVTLKEADKPHCEWCLCFPEQLAPIPNTICAQCCADVPGRGVWENSIIHQISHRRNDNGHLVFIMHGMNSEGDWATTAYDNLVWYNFNPSTPRYGKTSKRRYRFKKHHVEILDRLEKSILDKVQSFPNHKYSVIAHSFGTYLFAKLLELQTMPNFHRVVLNGAILTRSFDWEKHLSTGKVGRVLNVCGDRDVVPLKAAFANRDQGCSGTLFFYRDDDKIVNVRLEDTDHSDMVCDDEVLKDLWVPFLLDESFEPKRSSVTPKLGRFAARAAFFGPARR